jgi:hypothetical protein
LSPVFQLKVSKAGLAWRVVLKALTTLADRIRATGLVMSTTVLPVEGGAEGCRDLLGGGERKREHDDVTQRRAVDGAGRDVGGEPGGQGLGLGRLAVEDLQAASGRYRASANAAGHVAAADHGDV